MKWNTISKRELEVEFDTGTTVYCLDRLPTAARVVTNFATTVCCTNRELNEQDQALVKQWLGSQPLTIRYITDSQLDHIFNNESSRKNVKSL